MSSCLMAVSSVSSVSTTACTFSSDQRMPATGPATEARESMAIVNTYERCLESPYLVEDETAGTVVA
jgi:hypothetical protein